MLRADADRRRPVAYLDHALPIAFAHRGGAAHQPENSWAAFEHAIGLGYTHLETDARATRDGILLAFHDRTLDRVTDRSGRIARMPYQEVARARIGGTEEIPLIEDLIGTWPELRFNVDLKDLPAIRPMMEVLRRTRAWDRVCVTSFSARRLHAARILLDRPVCMALSPAGVAALGLAGGVPRFGDALAARLARTGVHCAQVPLRFATAPFIRRAHRAGLQVHVWTLNRRAEMERALARGADGIMTDETVLLREVLTAQGLWGT
ncbi:MAG TPA: glycerophosphodiester phosphodiesterase family protein [Streptosporangiaceae bacterium]